MNGMTKIVSIIAGGVVALGSGAYGAISVPGLVKDVDFAVEVGGTSRIQQLDSDIISLQVMLDEAIKQNEPLKVQQIRQWIAGKSAEKKRIEGHMK